MATPKALKATMHKSHRTFASGIMLRLMMWMAVATTMIQPTARKMRSIHSALLTKTASKMSLRR